MRTLLFVCSANTCRSAMAEALGRAMITEAKLGNRLQARSAGTAALDGLPLADLAQAALAKSFGKAPAHRSRQLTPALLAGDVLVVALTREHKDAALQLGAGPERLFTLGELAGEPSTDVEDPYGETEVRDSLGEIARLLRKAWPRLSGA